MDQDTPEVAIQPLEEKPVQAEVGQPKKGSLKTFIVVTAILVLAIVLLASLRWFVIQRAFPETTKPAQEQPPTPTPVRIISAVATQSGFVELEAMVASLSSLIAGYPLQDPVLSPPVVTLPLDLSQ